VRDRATPVEATTMAMGEADIRRWRRLRVAYLAGLIALFAAIAFYFGPNYFLFHKLTWMTPADFAPTVQRNCVPVVRAMKEFRRDNGRLPALADELVPQYLPVLNGQARVSVSDGEFRWSSEYKHRVRYDFNPATEGWIVEGVFTSGRIPLPPVTISPTTQPASTRPATGPSFGTE
jgi:hypothetical protein